MSLLFTERHIDLIRTRRKTATRRDWSDDYNPPTEGSIQMAVSEMFTSEAECDCYIRIERVYQEPLAAMTPADASKEGYTDNRAFRQAWEEINGEGSWDGGQVVDVVEFQYVGQSREAAAEQGELPV